MIIDFAVIDVKAGKGGDGAVAFRREKYVPKGGPSGGNGGRGGNVEIRAKTNLSTLLDYQYKKNYKAHNGANGGGALKDGKNGKDILLFVPVGTIIKDHESGEIIIDLDEDGKGFVAAKGGKGGKGNSNFATPTNQTPRFAEQGKPGGSRKLILELKLIADVGLIGFPNSGKSTFISTISAAKPKIADYPFTTLEPVLGIVRYKNYQSFTVADIPGIIEGAHEGKGLGHKFLRHIERTKILLFLIDIGSEDYAKDFDILLNELKSYSTPLAKKEKILVLTKADLLSEPELKKLKLKKIKALDSTPILISSVSRLGIEELLDLLWTKIQVN